MSSPSCSTSVHTNYLIKKISLFEASTRQLLDSISQVVDTQLETIVEQTSQKSDHKFDECLISSLNLEGKITCSTCQCSFEDRQEQIDHFRADFHLYNLKQKLKGKPTVTTDEFEKLSDISSISGSDTEEDNKSTSSSESETEQKTVAKIANHNNRPKIFFKLNDSTIISIFRSVLFSKQFSTNNQEEILTKVGNIKPENKWCIILVAAGHFAAAVFKGEQVIVHKTFHRYVVRAKRGGVQSQHDSSGKHAKSAGANIRRSQEAMFREEIKSLIGTEWKAEIDQCSCVFIRVPQYNKSVLIAGQNSAPFDKDDQRLRKIPFMTFRPTFNEVKRAHNLLSRVELYDKDFLHVLTKYETKIVESSKQEKPKSKPKTKPKSKPSPKTDKKHENVNDVELVEVVPEPKGQIQDEFIQSLSGENLKLFNEIYTSCMTNNVVKLRQLLNPAKDQEADAENYKLNIEKLINRRLNKQNGFTLLHVCGEMGFGECIWELLVSGCDPSIADLSRNKLLPYFVSQNKAIRDLYRRFMNDYPNRYDYAKAKIIEPLSLEKMAERNEKEKEKKRLKKQARKEREAVAKEKLTRQQIEDNERKLFLSLTDQEKRQLMIDRNFLNLMPINDKDDLESITKAKYSPQKIRIISRCWFCGVDMSSSVPFEYFDYKFCTTKCLKSHRQHHQDLKNLSLRP